MKARVRRLLLVLAAAALLLDGGLLLAGRLGAASLPEEDTAYFLDVSNISLNSARGICPFSAIYCSIFALASSSASLLM